VTGGGEKGVVNNLKKGHPTVLTTGSHLYFDHYQSLSKQEPKAFGGFSSLKKVYEYEPVPNTVEPEYKDLVIGVQANVWTEYMTTSEHVEYMTMPRMAALSELAWQAEGTKNWEHFRTKMDGLLQRYELLKINYAPSAYRPDIVFELDRGSKNLNVSLATELIADIYYTLDGTTPDIEESKKYSEPFVLKQATTVKAIAVKDQKVMVSPESKEAILHKARGAKVEVSPEPKGKYKAKGGYTLVDTDFGGNKWGNGKWLGMLSTDFISTIELDQETEISKIGYSCIEETQAGIYYPATIEVSVSMDGEKYKTVKVWKSSRKVPILKSPDIKTQTIELAFPPVSCRYVRVKTIYQRVPKSGVFVFVDEIIVE